MALRRISIDMLELLTCTYPKLIVITDCQSYNFKCIVIGYISQLQSLKVSNKKELTEKCPFRSCLRIRCNYCNRIYINWLNVFFLGLVASGFRYESELFGIGIITYPICQNSIVRTSYPISRMFQINCRLFLISRAALFFRGICVRDWSLMLQLCDVLWSLVISRPLLDQASIGESSGRKYIYFLNNLGGLCRRFLKSAGHKAFEGLS
jgi:hypothetical protein